MSSQSQTPFPRPANRDRPASPKASTRILVVDDDADLRQLNASVLTLSGYEVRAAEDGAAALAALDKDRYDLLITDHNMPKLTGVELLNQLHAAGKTLPAILVTGCLPREELQRYPWLNIAATLLKPFGPDELTAVVRRVLAPTAKPLAPNAMATTSHGAIPSREPIRKTSSR